MRRLSWLVGVALVAGALSACGGADGSSVRGAGGGSVGRGGGGRSSTSVTAPMTMIGVSAGSCAGLPLAAQFAAARTVFEGTFTPGSSATIQGQQVLASPAWLKVSRYLKGHGPDLVHVQTALASVGGVDRFAEDGITPSARQRWKIYSSSSSSPFATSACAGSAPMRSHSRGGF